MKGRVKILDKNKKSDKLKWNFTMGLLHGIFFTGGMGFSDPNTVLPVFVSSLTNSKILIGLFASTVETRGSFSRLGSVLPQLFVANKLETRTHKKPLLVKAIIVRALPISPNLSSSFVLVFALAGFCINGGRIGYTNYLLDISPRKRRPTYIGLSSTFLAPTAFFPLIAGVVIQYISFAFLFVLAALLVSMSFFLSLKLEEPRRYSSSS